MMNKTKMNNWAYLLSKGIIDSLLEQKIITFGEYQQVDSLNLASFS